MSDDASADPDELRSRLRASWERRAGAWEEHRRWFQDALEPVSQAMVDGIAPQPGHVIIEAAAGVGDTGLLAAELVHPGGRVILADGAEAMVEAARRHAQERGIANVEASPMELEWLDMPAASVDGLLVRFGYMLVPDPESALRDARRVLRPGGRIALAVWDRAADNPWHGVMTGVLADRGLVPPPATPDAVPADPFVPGPFALGDADALRELLGSAGFVLPEVERIEIAFRSEDAAAHRRRGVALSDTATRVLGELDAAERAAVEAGIDAALAAHADPDGPAGSVALAGAVLVATADA